MTSSRWKIGACFLAVTRTFLFITASTDPGSHVGYRRCSCRDVKLTFSIITYVLMTYYYYYYYY